MSKIHTAVKKMMAATQEQKEQQERAASRVDLAALHPAYKARHANLKLLISQHGTGKALSAKLGYSADGSFVSQMACDPPLRRMSETVARKIEQQLGLADGWMDTMQKGGVS